MNVRYRIALILPVLFLCPLLWMGFAYAELEDADDEFIDSEFYRRDKATPFLLDVFKGTSFGIRYRLDRSDGETSANRFQGQLKVKMNFELSDNFDLHIQPQTGGDRWSSGWDTFAPMGSDDADADLGFHFRRIFVEGQSDGGQILGQLGSMPSKAKGVFSTPLGVDSDGWIDGGRLMVRDIHPNIKKINLTGGGLDLSSADFFKRDWDFAEDEFYQAQIVGNAFEWLDFSAEYNRLNEENQFRGLAKFDVSKYTGDFLTNVYVEQLADIDNNWKHSGRTFGFIKPVIGRWKLKTAYVVNEQSDLARLLTAGPTRPAGKMFFAMLEKKLSEDGLSSFLRLRHCVAGECDNDYRYELGIRKRI